jgi:hypothetical protein
MAAQYVQVLSVIYRSETIYDLPSKYRAFLNGPHILLNGPGPFTLILIRPHAVIVFPMH